ncbi:MAG: type II toxin-antitoxin system death-on-curing family toxin [Planctomycetes bacterium]|nr:type II toxin-antitoxin system death-on-curing family toxin [Planctomycetota bacterium]
MIDTPSFLNLEHVLAIHRRMISEFGGNPSVRDPGFLESAVMMPAARFSGEFVHRDIPAMAAAYLFHLCKNHAFTDGNKRTALASAVIFIQINNMDIKATDDELERITIGVAEDTVTKDEVIIFFQKHIVVVKP